MSCSANNCLIIIIIIIISISISIIKIWFDKVMLVSSETGSLQWLMYTVCVCVRACVRVCVCVCVCFKRIYSLKFNVFIFN